MPLISESTITTISIPMVLDSDLMESKFDDYDRDQINGVTIIRDEDKNNAYCNLKDIVGIMYKDDPTNRMLNRLNSELAQIVERNREEWRARR